MNPFGDWRKTRVLLTGGTGLLGQALLPLLESLGAAVQILSRRHVTKLEAKPASWIGGDISEGPMLTTLLKSEQIDFIFHLAGCSQPEFAAKHPLMAFDVNAGGTWRLLEAIRLSGRRIAVIVASSESVYREGTATPFTEVSEVDPASPYAASKLAAELAVRTYSRCFGVPACIIRCSNLYGPGDPNPQRLIPSVIRAVQEGIRPVLNSDGTAERDFLYVDDAARGYVAVANALRAGRLSGEVINLATGVAISIRALTETILELCGRGDLEPVVLGRPALRRSRRCSSSAKAQELRWRPLNSIKDGLAKTLARMEASALSAASIPAQFGGL